MIVNDLLQSLGRPNMFFIWSLWSLMISYKASVAKKCVSFSLIWSSMIYYKASVAHICFLFVFYDRQWSSKKPRSPKYVFYLISILVNDLLQSLGRPNMFFIWSLWLSMISCKASVAKICFLFDLYDCQWSSKKPRSPKYFFIWSLWSSMISYKALISQNSIKFVSMIVNDLLQSLGRLNMLLFGFCDRQWSLTKFRSPKYVFYLFLWSPMISKKPQLPKYVSYLDSMIVNDLFHNLGRPKSVLFGLIWSSMIF